LAHEAEDGLRWVQIAGSDPKEMADAARFNVEQGAQIVDINMGCPAKKVCRKAAGSALLSDLRLVEAILRQVVSAVEVPVTLKIRTGPSPEQINAPDVARLAEDAGIAAITIHGRTRACRFNGTAEYDTIAAVKASCGMPVIANGDISNGAQAKSVLDYTGADAIMVGRAAQGRPWLFRDIQGHLDGKDHTAPLPVQVIWQTLRQHLDALHDFYGPYMGVRIARKHIGWFLDAQGVARDRKQTFNRLEEPEEQHKWLNRYFAEPFAAEGDARAAVPCALAS
jgi:tRNA-dihydrouridine synthase B